MKRLFSNNKTSSKRRKKRSLNSRRKDRSNWIPQKYGRSQTHLLKHKFNMTFSYICIKGQLKVLRCWHLGTPWVRHSFIQAPLLWQMWSAGGRPGVSGWISDSSITAHLLRQRCWAKHRRLCRLLPSIMHSWPWQPFTELLAHFWLSVPKSFPAMANHVLF